MQVDLYYNHLSIFYFYKAQKHWIYLSIQNSCISKMFLTLKHFSKLLFQLPSSSRLWMLSVVIEMTFCIYSFRWKRLEFSSNKSKPTLTVLP